MHSVGWRMVKRRVGVSKKSEIVMCHLYINLACLFVCLFVCLYTINVKTAKPIGPKFFVGSRVTPGKIYEWSYAAVFDKLFQRHLKLFSKMININKRKKCTFLQTSQKILSKFLRFSFWEEIKFFCCLSVKMKFKMYSIKHVLALKKKITYQDVSIKNLIKNQAYPVIKKV